MHGARGGAPEGERNGNYRHGARTKEAIEWKAHSEVGLAAHVCRCSQSSTLTIQHLTLYPSSRSATRHTTTDPLHGVDAHFDFVPLCATVSDDRATRQSVFDFDCKPPRTVRVVAHHA